MQRIEIQIQVYTGGYQLRLLGVYKLDNKLLTISNIKTPSGFVTMATQLLRQVAQVETGSAEKLEVINYLINDDSNEKIFTSSQFTAINQNDVANLVANAELLYQPRDDGLRALRVKNYESQQPDAFSVTESKVSNEPVDVTDVLNVYMHKQNDDIKLVLETISKKRPYSKDISYLFNFIGKFCENIFSMENDFYLITDDKIKFKAESNNQLETFTASALDFNLPYNNPRNVLYFMLLLDAIILPEKIKRSEHHDPFSHIQISEQSILACVDDLSIENADPYRQTASLSNALSSSMENFLQKPGTLANPESLAHPLMTSIMQRDTLSKHAGLREHLINFYQLFGATSISHVSRYLGLMFKLNQIDAMYYYADANNFNLVKEAENILKQENYFNLLKPFIANFQHSMIDKLLSVAHYSRQSNEPYKWQSTEYNLLRNATFHIRDDDRLSIKVSDNVIYQSSYAEKPDVYRSDMDILFGKLRINYSADCNIQEEIIFDAESSQRLKNYGLHINASNLQRSFSNVLASTESKPTSISSSLFHTRKPANSNQHDKDDLVNDEVKKLRKQ